MLSKCGADALWGLVLAPWQVQQESHSLSLLHSQVLVRQQASCHGAIGQQLDAMLLAEIRHCDLRPPVYEAVLHLNSAKFQCLGSN